MFDFFASIEFEQINDGQRLFGFTEFITGLAIMFVIWSTVGVKYHFRIEVAPFSLKKNSFYIISTIGLFTIFIDFLRVKELRFLTYEYFDYVNFQLFLALMYFLIFMLWVYYSYFKDPSFTIANHERFTRFIHAVILSGSPSDSKIIAVELKGTMGRIIKFAPTENYFVNGIKNNSNVILNLIADKKFCKVIVDEYPILIAVICDEIIKQQKTDVKIDVFLNNIIEYSFKNKESFIYNEHSYHDSGYFGAAKPIASRLFSRLYTLSNKQFLLKPKSYSFENEEWSAYFNSLTLAVEAYLNNVNSEENINSFRSLGRYIETAFKNVCYIDNRNDSVFLTILTFSKFVDDVIFMIEKSRRSTSFNEAKETELLNLIIHLSYSIFINSLYIDKNSDNKYLIHRTLVWDKVINKSVFFEKISGEKIQDKIFRKIEREISLLNFDFNSRSFKILTYVYYILGVKSNNVIGYDENLIRFHNSVILWSVDNLFEVLISNSSNYKFINKEGIIFFPEESKILYKNGIDNEPIILELLKPIN